MLPNRQLRNQFPAIRHQSIAQVTAARLWAHMAVESGKTVGKVVVEIERE
jgi:hypothetical protein